MLLTNDGNKKPYFSKFFIDYNFPTYNIVGVIKVLSLDDKGRSTKFCLVTKKGEEFIMPNFEKRKNKKKYINRKVKINAKVFEDKNGDKNLLDGYKIKKVFQKKNSHRVSLEDLLY